jgi:hypothetical protein
MLWTTSKVKCVKYIKDIFIKYDYFFGLFMMKLKNEFQIDGNFEDVEKNKV